jgi:hypothetical protein
MDRTARRVTGFAAVLAPLVMLASTISHVAQGDGLNDGEAGGIIQVWAFIALGIAIVGLARLLEPSTARGALLVVVLGIGGVAAGAGYGIDSIAADVHSVDSLQDVDSSPAAPLALQLPGLMNTLSLVVLGVLLARHRTAPPVAAYAVVAGAVVFLVARIPDIEALALVGDAILVLGLGGVGLSVLGRGADRPEVVDATG